MALKVKTAAESAVKWGDNAARAASAYAVGAAAAAATWEANTVGAQGNYQKGITAPGVATRFGNGVKKAGAGKYGTKVSTIGKDRFPGGVSAGKNDYQTGVDPYLQTLTGLTLSPRSTRGDISNYNRVTEVGKALNAKRLAMLGGS